MAGERRADAKAVRVVRPAVAAAEGRPAASGFVVLPRTGLVFPRRLPFQAWLGIGAQLAAVATSSAWCLGDWLAYGKAAYGGRYRDAIEWTGLDYQTLRNYAWVAGRFELSRRRDTLSFGHHAEVAALSPPEQDFWLRKAEEFHWSTMRLRREVRASLAERGHKPLGLEPGGSAACQENGQGNPAMVRVSLNHGALELCERAADLDGMTLHAWAAQTLERAARRSLQRLVVSPGSLSGVDHAACGVVSGLFVAVGVFFGAGGGGVGSCRSIRAITSARSAAVNFHLNGVAVAL